MHAVSHNEHWSRNSKGKPSTGQEVYIQDYTAVSQQCPAKGHDQLRISLAC